MTLEHRQPIASYVTKLVSELLRAGFNEEFALRTGRFLVNVTINLALSEIIAPSESSRRKKRSRKEIEFKGLIITRSDTAPTQFQGTSGVFKNAIDTLNDCILFQYRLSEVHFSKEKTNSFQCIESLHEASLTNYPEIFVVRTRTRFN